MATMMYQRMADRSQADPHPHVVLVSRRLGYREQLGAELERQGWCVRYADSVTAAARELVLAPADVLVLDGWAAITGSVSALERLLVSQPGLAVVVSSPISLEDRRAQHLVERRVQAVYSEGAGGADTLVRLLSNVLEHGKATEENPSIPKDRRYS